MIETSEPESPIEREIGEMNQMPITMTHSMQDLQRIEMSEATQDEYVFKGSCIEPTDQLLLSSNSPEKKISITVESPTHEERQS